MVGGFFLLDVATREEALAIARDCPAVEWATVEVAAGSVASQPLTLTAPAGTRGRHGVRFDISAVDSEGRETVDSSFFGPM